MNISRNRLRRILKTSKLGTPTFNVRNRRVLGIDVEYEFARDESPLIEALSLGIPPICTLKTHALPYWQDDTAHAVVLVDYTDGQLTINDPAYAHSRHEVSLDEFYLGWADMGECYVLLRPLA